MVKLVVLYKTPEDPSTFETHFANAHLPRVKKWPGLRKIEVATVTGATIGEPKLYMIEELYFDDEESMQGALASADGKAVAFDLMEFEKDSIAVLYADVKDV
ncbi:MAG: EthD family reductase [Ignavibacteria bacterium]|nr:EthD family reductase [Ignavibacteria bacterium]